MRATSVVRGGLLTNTLLDDLLAERGNQAISDLWDIHRTSMIAAVIRSEMEPEALSL
ncbi:MAG TPA: hypothetical protein VJ846_08590 [Sphingomicrobium sp.]|nr:hypothetical protein [Sphingomicrobium sp.]